MEESWLQSLAVLMKESSRSPLFTRSWGGLQESVGPIIRCMRSEDLDAGGIAGTVLSV